MVVGFDHFTVAASASWSGALENPVAAGDLLLIVLTARSGSINPTSISYGGVSLVEILIVNPDFPSVCVYAVPPGDNPAAGASHTLDVTLNSSSSGLASLIKIDNVAPAALADLTLLLTEGNGTTINIISVSQDITTPADNYLILDFVGLRDSAGAAAGADQTLNYLEAFESPRAGGSSFQDAPVAGVYTMSWSWDGFRRTQMAVLGIPLISSSATPVLSSPSASLITSSSIVPNVTLTF